MEDTKCYFVQLATIYAQRILYGYECDLDKLWSDILEFRRAVRLEENITNCNLRGVIIDEINKLKKRLAKDYSLTCPNC